MRRLSGGGSSAAAWSWRSTLGPACRTVRALPRGEAACLHAFAAYPRGIHTAAALPPLRTHPAKYRRPSLAHLLGHRRPLLALRCARYATDHDETVKPAEVVATHDERELVKRAQSLWEEDKTEEAIQTLHQIIAGDPDNYDLIEKLGDMYLAVGHYDASALQYTLAMELLDQQPSRGLQQWSQRMSYILVKRGESRERSQRGTSFDDAEADYKRAIELNPGCAEAYHRLGYLNLKEGYTQTAEAAFDKGISNAGEHGLILAEMWYGKGEIRRQSNTDWRKAIQCFRKACEVDSTYAPAFFKLGQVLQKDKDWLGAIQAYDKYFDMFHAYYGTYGVDAADQRLDSSALISDVMLRRGACYVEYKEPEAALSDLDGVIAIENPQFVPLALLWRGKAYFQKSEFWKAIDDYTEAIKRDPQLMEAYRERSGCYDVVGLSKEAEEDKERYELLKRSKSWEMRQAMIDSHFGPGKSKEDNH